VVDASVGIKLFVAEDLSDKAYALFAQLAGVPPAQFLVPDLFYIECANILWKYVRRLGHPADKARQDMIDLSGLLLQRTATAELAMEALDVALVHGIAAYDACYVALAQRLRVPLVTADEKLARALSSASSQVQWLGDLALPPPPGP
jgi:predicted nucleic acid-binding protein